MPKMSQKCEYGLRVVLELTRRKGQGPVSVSVISAAQAVPLRFLELIVKELRHARIVRSYRGAKGGYTLRANPQRLTIGRIIRLLDGPLSPMDCIACGGKRRCSLRGACSFEAVWKQATRALEAVYDSVTFEQLAAEPPKPGR